MPNQRQRLKDKFMVNPGRRIPLPEILDMRIAQYGRVIHELRTLEGMDIENGGEWVNGSHHTWFRYHEPAVKILKEQYVMTW